MPRAATGTAFEERGRWYARITLGPKRPKIPLPTCTTRPAAEARRDMLAGLAERLRAAKVPADAARTFLVSAGAAAEGKPLDKVRATVDAVCRGDARRIDDPSKPITFQQLAERWTSGELARQHPDHVKKKDSADNDRSRLERQIYPLVGHVTIVAFGLDDGERVMRSLPPCAPATRVHYAKLMHRILSLAVFPLRIITVNPLPRGFIPRGGAPKAKGYLYPDEDRKLLARTSVPLCWRFFYGFLAREGCRSLTEAARFTLSDADLQRGAIKLDENKTDDPRAWALDPGVARALRAYIALREREMGRPMLPDELLFVDEHGRPITHSVARRFRADLKAAGVDRPELFERSASRLRIRVHDLRATFITINLANGKTETWISDRTGHKSSDEINGYRRQARTAMELGLGELTPLDQAIPELCGREDASSRASSDEPPGRAAGSPESSLGASEASPTIANGSQPHPVDTEIPGESSGRLPLEIGSGFQRYKRRGAPACCFSSGTSDGEGRRAASPAVHVTGRAGVLLLQRYERRGAPSCCRTACPAALPPALLPYPPALLLYCPPRRCTGEPVDCADRSVDRAGGPVTVPPVAQSGRATSRLDPQASRSPVRRAAVRRLQRWHRADGRVRSQDGVGTDGTGARLWAWLFVHATELTEMPADLSPGPYRDALELANQATFTQEELQT